MTTRVAALAAARAACSDGAGVYDGNADARLFCLLQGVLEGERAGHPR